MQEILRLLLERTGIDFASYCRGTVRRRILNRMISLGSDSLDDYVSRLHGSEEEAVRLAERITIKVSRFYRNASTFDRVRSELLPELAATRSAPLRLWSAGCGHGEEAYHSPCSCPKAASKAR
jgi:chemotaxis methyl-accepting protein methylase